MSKKEKLAPFKPGVLRVKPNYYLACIRIIALSFLTSCDTGKVQSLYDDQVPADNPSHKCKTIADSLFNIELICIPSGEIKMTPNYLRKHTYIASIDSFYIGKYEITQKQWEDVMGSYPPEFKWEDFDFEKIGLDSTVLLRWMDRSRTSFINENYPAVVVSWEAVQKFVIKLSEKTGHFYRLPTNEEWEYAYRAGTTTEYYFGDDTLLLDEYEWYDENSAGTLHPVGLKKPNPFGLYDIGGNAAEWTATLADLEPYTRKYGREFGKGVNRIYRGSHYLHTKFAANATWTHTYKQVLPHRSVGFRVVREK